MDAPSSLLLRPHCPLPNHSRRDRCAQLLDDLLELHSFLTQYAAELAAGGAGGGAVSSLPTEQQLDSTEVQARLAAVSEAIETIDNEHARHLLLLCSEDKYLARQVASLRQMLDTSEKMRARADELQTRQAELVLVIKSAHPKYEAAVGAIKAAKAELEGALSTHLSGRRVNLMGDINQL